MKNHLVKLKCMMLLVVIIPGAARSQTQFTSLEWKWNEPNKLQYLKTKGDQTIYSYIGDPSNRYDIEENMVIFNYKRLFNLSEREIENDKLNLSAVGTGSEVKVSVYIYDRNADHPFLEGKKGGKGQLIYQASADKINQKELKYYTMSDVPTDLRGNKIAGSVSTRDSRKIIQEQDLYNPNPNIVTQPPSKKNFISNFLDYLSFHGEIDTPHPAVASQYYKLTNRQPVIVQLDIVNEATIAEIKIPGIEQRTLLRLFDRPNFDFNIDQAKATSTSNGINLKSKISMKPGLSAFQLFKASDARFVFHKSDTKVVTFDITDTDFINKNLVRSNSVTFDANILPKATYDALPAGRYKIGIRYSGMGVRHGEIIDVWNHEQHLTFITKQSTGDLTVYDIKKAYYDESNNNTTNTDNGTPSVYTLKGGMSAEYCVEKSLAILDKGISEVWHTDDGGAGADGGPLPVLPTQDFFENSIKKTISYYEELGASRKYKTVIIGPGIPNIPYFSMAFQAPYLPIHFLVSAESVAEIAAMSTQASNAGYPNYCTLGYDPSMKGVGVAWMKMLELPQEYLDFMRNHSVEQVIIVGINEHWGSENECIQIDRNGKNIPYNSTNGLHHVSYEDGDLFMMALGAAKSKEEAPVFYSGWKKDFDIALFSNPKKYIADWETGIADASITKYASQLPASIHPYAITTIDSYDAYIYAANVMALLMKKNNKSTINGVALNEYVIGFPQWEYYNGYMPYLYWQGGHPDSVAVKLEKTIGVPMKSVNPNVDFKSINYYLNAQADRTKIKNALLKLYPGKVSMSPWKRHDVFDPSDGMNSISEKKLLDIIHGSGYGSTITPIEISDLTNTLLVPQEYKVSTDVFPQPDDTKTLIDKSTSDGVKITRSTWVENKRWQEKVISDRMDFWDLRSTEKYKDRKLNGFKGFLDDYIGTKFGNEKNQDITTLSLDLANTSDEYELKVDYVFNPVISGHPLDPGTYDKSKGIEQTMSCFEYVAVPENHWLDIPSRVMARNGAIWVVNGTVYDWDYNGVPGVVPFVKKNGVVKAQPQILSFKAEGLFAFQWGQNKSVTLQPRDNRSISSIENLVKPMRTIYQSQAQSYSNALSGITFMSPKTDNSFDIERLQPQWMKDYPRFEPKYISGGGTSVRCTLANPSKSCYKHIAEYGGPVPTEEGWNDCSNIAFDDNVAKFSALAYQQYDGLFEIFPNGRTFIGLKYETGTTTPKTLDIGVISGDLGEYPKNILTKKQGMHVYEEFDYAKNYKGYDKFLNLDGGSSTQMWINGMGPVFNTDGYPLVDDNQGPYMSRLGSTFLLLVPKVHNSEINVDFPDKNLKYLRLDNSHIDWNYGSKDDNRKKSFVSLSIKKTMDAMIHPKAVAMHKYSNDSKYGLLAGNFRVDNSTNANGEKPKGAILFSISEDGYYPSTGGTSKVIPQTRNLTVVGVGQMPQILVDSLKKVDNYSLWYPSIKSDIDLVSGSLVSFYQITIKDRKLVDWHYSKSGNYLDGNWHSFYLRKSPGTISDGSTLYIDDHSVGAGPLLPTAHLFDVNNATHAMIGGVNIDGRFITGNTRLDVDNFLVITGGKPNSRSANEMVNGVSFTKALTEDMVDYSKISSELTNSRRLPMQLYKQESEKVRTLGYKSFDVYAFGFEEENGQHSFALRSSEGPTPYGLNLNVERRTYAADNARIADKEEQENLENDNGFLLYPNPVGSDALTVSFKLEESSKVGIAIHNLNGQLVWKQENDQNYEAGQHNVKINSVRTKLGQTGIYIVKVKTATFERSGKIIVE